MIIAAMRTSQPPHPVATVHRDARLLAGQRPHGVGKFIKSARFTVVGYYYDWTIKLYPGGVSAGNNCCYMRAASANVTLCTGAVTANANYTLSLVGRYGLASRV
jgi:hypothetical protein